MTLFYGWGSTVSRLQRHRERIVLTIQLPGVPGTQLIDLGRMKDWVDSGATQCFWRWDPCNGNPAPKPLDYCSVAPINFNITIFRQKDVLNLNESIIVFWCLYATLYLEVLWYFPNEHQMPVDFYFGFYWEVVVNVLFCISVTY